MKIFLIIPTLMQGGAERVVSELANIWSKQHQIHIILLAEGEQFYNINDTIKIDSLGFKTRQGKLKKITSEIQLFFKLRKIIRDEKPDFILSFMNKYNIFTLFATIGLNQKVIVSERDSPTEKLSYKTVFLRNFSYKWADGIICQTNLSKKFIEKETKNQNVISIPNPVKNISLDPKVKKEKIIINIGRLVSKKGQHYLLESFSKLTDKSWKLVLLGEGPLRKDLEESIKKLKIENQVLMPGSVKNIDEWLNKASIFAFPSILEGFPNALAEAMAAGLPCVSFNCDTGPSDLIINGKNGFLVEVGDVVMFTSRLEELIQNKYLRDNFSTEAKQVSYNLNTEHIASKYLDFCIKENK